MEAWVRDPIAYSRSALESLSARYARTKGEVLVGDAVRVAETLDADDVVFVDPPYSNVQYSRFYHVLETLAKGYSDGADGVGRYPSRAERPQSDFSRKGSSRQAFTQLMSALSKKVAKVVLTFPAGKSSNGLSGELVVDLVGERFKVVEQIIYGRFSTLGGNSQRRQARQESKELVLILTPR
jgi:adenine-specific DNA methylase